MDEYLFQEKSSYDKLLDFLVFLSVAVVTLFFILEVIPADNRPFDIVALNSAYFYVNIIVLFIFTLDLIRLYKQATNFKSFVAHNWLDIAATIPFGLMSYYLGGKSLAAGANAALKLSRIAKLEKMAKASRVSKIGKEFKAASHVKRESDEYKKKHRL